MTSIELPPDLYRAARLCAVRRGITFRALIEETLRQIVGRKEDKDQ